MKTSAMKIDSKKNRGYKKIGNTVFANNVSEKERLKIMNEYEYMGTTTWTLKDSDGKVVTFKMLKCGNIEYSHWCVGTVTTRRNLDKDSARELWKECMKNDFCVVNKCMDHNMNNFYKKHREQEMISASYDSYMTKRNKNEMCKYALEA